MDEIGHGGAKAPSWPFFISKILRSPTLFWYNWAKLRGFCDQIVKIFQLILLFFRKMRYFLNGMSQIFSYFFWRNFVFIFGKRYFYKLYKNFVPIL